MHYAGDAVLADFDTVTDALGCAVSVQSMLGSENDALSEGRRVAYPHEEQADAVNVFACLMLRDLLPGDGPRPEVFVELLEEENESLLEPDEQGVIVSPLIVSYLLSQVSLRQELARLFAELSRPWGTQIDFRPAKEYLPMGDSVGFRDLEDAAAERGEIALGLRRTQGPGAGLLLNPDKSKRWSLASGDEVVVLPSYVDRGQED